jgi:hypothetical protein
VEHILSVYENGYLFTVNTKGDCDAEGIIAFLMSIISHPKWKLGYNIFLDHKMIDDPDFGYCITCDEPIGYKRLMIMPE